VSLSAQLRLRYLPCALALAVLVTCVPATAYGAPAAPAALAAKQAQARQEAAQLKSMRAQLAIKLAGYRKISASLDRTQREIDDNTARLQVLEKRLGTARNGLDSHVDYLYRSRGGGLLTVLFSAVTFDDFVTRMDIVSSIADQDASLVHEIRDERAEATRLRRTLAEREAMLKGLRSSADAERARVQADVDQQQAAVGSLDADVARILRDSERADAAKTPYVDPVSSKPASGGGSKPTGGNTSLITVSVVQHPGVTFLAMKGSASTYSATGVKFTGKASVYSVAENGHGTASGRPLNDNELTCAHKSLPFGTRIALTRGSHRIIVVVTDRGPYTGGRVLDLTTRGASLLGIDGVGSVTAEVVEAQ
jgi:rare lipoprotein A (peptidoglycan hydrolase)